MNTQERTIYRRWIDSFLIYLDLLIHSCLYLKYIGLFSGAYHAEKSVWFWLAHRVARSCVSGDSHVIYYLSCNLHSYFIFNMKCSLYGIINL